MGAGRRLRWATLLLAALAAAPAGADLERIHQLAGRGRTQQALRQLEDLLVRDPEMAEGQLLRGVLLYQLDRRADAERAFRELSLQLPDHPEPANNLAVLQAAGGRRATAIKALERILAEHPGFEMAARNLEAVRSGPAPMRADLRYAPDSAIDPESAESPRLRLILASRMGAGSPGPASPTAVPGSAATAPPEAPPPAPRPRAAPPATAAEPATEPELLPPPPQAEPPAVDEPPAADEPPAPAEGARRMPDAPADPVAEPGPPAAAPAPEAPTRPAPPVPDRRAALASMVEAWAAAWSEQRVKEYLAYYATDFEPAGYPSREAWEAVRRQRVAAPSFIEVEIDPGTLEVSEAGPGEASVTFTQTYRSDRFSDTVVKTLDLVREAGAWRIRRELVR